MFYEPVVVPSPMKKQPNSQSNRIVNGFGSLHGTEFDESDDEEEQSNISSTSASQRCQFKISLEFNKIYAYLLIIL